MNQKLFFIATIIFTVIVAFLSAMSLVHFIYPDAQLFPIMIITGAIFTLIYYGKLKEEKFAINDALGFPSPAADLMPGEKYYCLFSTQLRPSDANYIKDADDGNYVSFLENKEGTVRLHRTFGKPPLTFIYTPKTAWMYTSN